MIFLEPKTIDKELQAEQRKDFRYLGRKKLKKGFKIFSLNLETGEIKEAKIINKVSINFRGEKVEKKELFEEKMHIYTDAFNLKSAINQFEKKIFEAKKLYYKLKKDANKAENKGF